MQRQLVLTTDRIEEAAWVAKRKMSPEMGAAVCFTGVVRGLEADAEVAGLEYEAFQKMAEHQFHLIFDEAERQWPIESIRLVHRLGAVAVGEPSLWVEVVAPHRGQAFAACQFIIDEMKRLVPIWKKPLRNFS